MVGIIKIYITVLFILFLTSCKSGMQNDGELNAEQQEYILTKVKNYHGLLKLYRQKLSLHEDSTVRFKLSECYNKIGDYESSLYYLMPLIENKPTDKVYLLQARNLIATGNDQMAQDAITLALETNDRNGEAHNILGVIQAQQGKFKAAYHSFNRARELFVSEEQVVNNLAMLMLLQGNYPRAYNYLMPLYLRGNSTSAIKHNLVFVLVKMHNYEEADSIIRANSLSDNPTLLISELTSIDARVSGNSSESFSFRDVEVSDKEVPVISQKEVVSRVRTIKTANKKNSASDNIMTVAESPSSGKSGQFPESLIPSKAFGVASATTRTVDQLQSAPSKKVALQSLHIPPANQKVIEKLAPPPSVRPGASAGDIIGNSNKHNVKQSAPTVNMRKGGNLNEVTNAGFVTHAGFSRLTLEFIRNINFDKIAQNRKDQFQIILYNTRQGKKTSAMLSKISHQVGLNHRDIKEITVLPDGSDALLVTFYFVREVNVEILRLPPKKNKNARLVFKFI